MKQKILREFCANLFGYILCQLFPDDGFCPFTFPIKIFYVMYLKSWLHL